MGDLGDTIPSQGSTTLQDILEFQFVGCFEDGYIWVDALLIRTRKPT
jgi:hypothetical protein